MAIQVSKVNVAVPETVTQVSEQRETSATESVAQAQAKLDQGHDAALSEWSKIRLQAQDMHFKLPDGAGGGNIQFKRPDGAGGGNIQAAVGTQGRPGLDVSAFTPIPIRHTATRSGAPSPGDTVELTPIQIPRTSDPFAFTPIQLPRTATATEGSQTPGEAVELTPIQLPRTGVAAAGLPTPDPQISATPLPDPLPVEAVRKQKQEIESDFKNTEQQTQQAEQILVTLLKEESEERTGAVRGLEM